MTCTRSDIRSKKFLKFDGRLKWTYSSLSDRLDRSVCSMASQSLLDSNQPSTSQAPCTWQWVWPRGLSGISGSHYEGAPTCWSFTRRKPVSLSSDDPTSPRTCAFPSVVFHCSRHHRTSFAFSPVRLYIMQIPRCTIMRFRPRFGDK